MERKSQIELTNMCLICDGTRILVEEKRGTSYPGGLIFPGGHVEKDESLRDPRNQGRDRFDHKKSETVRCKRLD